MHEQLFELSNGRAELVLLARRLSDAPGICLLSSPCIQSLPIKMGGHCGGPFHVGRWDEQADHRLTYLAGALAAKVIAGSYMFLTTEAAVSDYVRLT